jgi:hypothetical protein
MATANGNSNVYSLKDILAAKDPNGQLAKVAEILQQSNTMVEDMPMMEGLLEVGDQITVRSQLGSPGWKRFNEYASPSVAKTNQVTELTGHIEDWSQIDCDLVDKSADPAGFMLRDARPKMMAMGQEVVSTAIYGNASVDPKTFTGFMPRLSTLNTTYMSGDPVVLNAGGTTAGAQASILLIGWGEDLIHGIYPKGSTGGLKFDNKGKVTSEQDGKFLDVYRSKFSQDIGLAVRDYRYMVRIANIDVASLSTIGTSAETAANLYTMLLDALSYIPHPEQSNLVIYAPRIVWSAMSRQAAKSGNAPANTSIKDRGLIFDIFGVPFKRQDAMLETESVIA